MTWQYEYVARDHLGNTRVCFADRNGNGRIELPGELPAQPDYTEIIQENHYYPFGLELSGPWAPPQTQPDNPYRYNGKEHNPDLGLDWYDYGARWYDAAIARWGQVDQLGEKYYQFSSWIYVIDNPVKLIDPEGKTIYVYAETDQARQEIGEIVLMAAMIDLKNGIESTYKIVEKSTIEKGKVKLDKEVDMVYGLTEGSGAGITWTTERPLGEGYETGLVSINASIYKDADLSRRERIINIGAALSHEANVHGVDRKIYIITGAPPKIGGHQESEGYLDYNKVELFMNEGDNYASEFKYSDRTIRKTNVFYRYEKVKSKVGSGVLADDCDLLDLWFAREELYKL